MTKKIQRSNMTQTDSRGNVMREPKKSAEDAGGYNFQWWKSDISTMAQDIAGTIKFISTHQGNRIEQLTVSTRLYGNTSAFNLLGTAFTRSSSVNSNPMSDRISYNLVASVIDTLTSKMSSNKVLPTFITNGGDWNIQKKAKKLTKFAQGWAYGIGLHDMTMEQWNDAGVWGDGFVHVFRDAYDKAAAERVLPHELFVDIVEAMCSTPHSMHRVKIADRFVVCDMWPEFEEQIMSVSPANYQEIGGQGTSANLIQVSESWHLKSGPEAEDGIHAICVGDSVLNPEDLEYEKDYFPFVKLPYVKRKLGYYGQGAAERLQRLQGEVNRGMITIQKSHWLQAGPKIAISNTSKIVTQHLSNELGTIIKHEPGEPPAYLTPPIIQGEVYQWVDSLIAKGYQQEGLSEMQAAGEKPMGVDSGKALRTLTDIEDARFEHMAQNVEKATLEIIRQGIEVVKDIYKEKKSYEVCFPSTQFIETVDWKDINLEADQYVLKAYPTSSLATDLTGRLSDVQELAQAGMIDPRTARRLMDMPDVEMNSTLANAAEDRLHKIFEQILEDGDLNAKNVPEPTMDLSLASILILQYINYGEYMGAPPENIQLLRDWNSQLQDLVKQAMPPAPPMAQPQANPAPAPTSNLLPNAPGGMTQ